MILLFLFVLFDFLTKQKNLSCHLKLILIKSSGFNKIFSPILSNTFLIRIINFLLFLQYFVWKQTYKDNKNFVILVKKFIWHYKIKYFVEPTTFVFSVSLFLLFYPTICFFYFCLYYLIFWQNKKPLLLSKINIDKK